jgi:hypothetical protein
MSELQHHGMNEREDGCGRADPETESEHDGDRQYRSASHLTQGIAKIAQQGSEHAMVSP